MRLTQLTNERVARHVSPDLRLALVLGAAGLLIVQVFRQALVDARLIARWAAAAAELERDTTSDDVERGEVD